MKTAINLSLGIGIVLIVIGLVSRVMMLPLPVAPHGISSRALFSTANTFLLLAIALSLSGCKK